MASQQLAEIVERGHEVLHRPGRIGLEIAAPDDAFLGVKVDQNDRPVGERGDARDDRPIELQDDGPGPDVTDRQRIDSRLCHVMARVHVLLPLDRVR
jgi:hypothetical protein